VGLGVARGDLQVGEGGEPRLDLGRVEGGGFQGESRLTRDNIPLGEFTLTLQPRPIDRQALELRFTYECTVFVRLTGIRVLRSITGM
jgi:hypothetical protein